MVCNNLVERYSISCSKTLLSYGVMGGGGREWLPKSFAILRPLLLVTARWTAVGFRSYQLLLRILLSYIVLGVGQGTGMVTHRF